MKKYYLVMSGLLPLSILNMCFAAQDNARSSLSDASSVKERVKENNRPKSSVYQSEALQKALQPYYQWKQDLNEKHNLDFSFSAYFQYLNLDETVDEDTDAAGAVLRFQGSWTPVLLSDGSTGSVNFRFEKRDEIGGMQAPATLGGEISSAFNPGFGYSANFSTDLAVINWTQGFDDNNYGIAIGRLAFDAYLDAFPFQTFSRGFLNRAFILNPTMGTTGIGALGVVAKGYASDNIWLGAHLYDGNAVNGEFDLDTFREHEYLTALEFGWTPGKDRRKTDRVQVTYWQKDARQLADVEKGSGWVVSASYQMGDRLLPFVRYGNSDGGAGVAAKQSLSIGGEYTLTETQALSVGFGWNEANKQAIDNRDIHEYILESSYRIQLSPNFSITPDLQWLKNPANLDGQADTNWAFALRAILTI